jgi:hypothetical protein
MSICHNGWKKITKVFNMYLSRLHNGVFKNVSFGPKNQGKKDKSGMRHVWNFLESTPKEIEYPTKTRCLIFFYWKLFTSIPFYLHFFFKSMQTYLCTFANLLIKYSFFKKLCSTNKLLYFVTTSRMLWRWL